MPGGCELGSINRNLRGTCFQVKLQSFRVSWRCIKVYFVKSLLQMMHCLGGWKLYLKQVNTFVLVFSFHFISPEVHPKSGDVVLSSVEERLKSLDAAWMRYDKAHYKYEHLIIIYHSTRFLWNIYDQWSSKSLSLWRKIEISPPLWEISLVRK